MDGARPEPGRSVVLRGRHRERAVLDRVLEGVRDGRSGVLVVRGEAGVGKTALLEAALTAAGDLRVVRAVGVESEMELPFAALHQLCAPFLDRRGGLPGPQRLALEIVFGLSGGPVPDRLLVGLGVLSLFSEAAEERPLVCVVDDAQWLDQTSALTLAFVARRLAADQVGLLFGAREPGVGLRDLPELELRGLRNGDARALLNSAVPWRLDEQVRNVILAETRGNPLALLELPRGLSRSQLAGGFGVTFGSSLSARIEQSFMRQFGSFPEETKRLMLVAAAEPVGDPELLWAAARRLDISYDALEPAASAGLLQVGSRVAFRHALVRSGVYRVASLGERQRVHAALAQVTDPQFDPDRLAWHRAQAAPEPDEQVAQELEHSAGRAQARGGLAAAAAFLERAAQLSVDTAPRAERMLAAAQVHVQAGASEAALALLAAVPTGASDELLRARMELLRGQIAFGPGVGGDASGLLLNAAVRLEPLDLKLARETYLEAWGAALFAGDLAGRGRLLEVSRAARSAPAPTHPPLPFDLLLDGLAALITDGRAAAAPALRAAVSAFAGAETTVEDALRWGWIGQAAALVLWDEASWYAISARQVQLDRDAGALARLPIDLTSLAMSLAWFGEFDAAASLIEETEVVAEATRITQVEPFGAMSLAALRGRKDEALAIVDATITRATAGGQGVAVQYANWVAAVLANGLGRYEEALVSARLASDDTPELYVAGWALVELVEAAVRSGHALLATEGVERLVASTQPIGTDWALGIEARSRALISEATTADALYREAIDRFSRTRLRTELGRAHLLYGEWLRREGRSVDARVHLRACHEMFDEIGMEAFAARAASELLATGERARTHTVTTHNDLTAQQLQIAQMARDGLTNPEIGTRLFISSRTVEWHLRKVFMMLNVSSRKQLVDALPRRATDARAI